MRFYLFFSALLTVFSSCNSGSKQTDTPTTEAAATSPDTVCYQQVTGRDTTTLRLVVNGSDVTGELAVLPYEKDRARGPISGTLADNQIRANWQRTGEGVTQPYEITFTLAGDAVTWREGERVEQQGRWILKDPSGGFEYKVLKTECR
ncbi:hypothetical protein LX87_03406 [Larkinella arboricola]|uniref:Lipoprotein n=1 Tax=Larkinella arboricola TaxID=643671 RepID=A0A327WSP5_LARAB|nr:hypothetical protein [Larkinella arboricola]RAJ95658.1 hypothetical protein LX87_03406 [Larkinella arboricola]